MDRRNSRDVTAIQPLFEAVLFAFSVGFVFGLVV
jgi:hypothetical protein